MAVAMTESSRCWHLGPTWQLTHSTQDLLILILMSMMSTMDVGAQKMVVTKVTRKASNVWHLCWCHQEILLQQIEKRLQSNCWFQRWFRQHLRSTEWDPSVVIQAHSHDKDLSQSTHMRSRNARKNHPWQILRFDIETHICYWIAFIGNFVWWRCGNICRDHIFRILSEWDLQDGSHSKVLLTVAWVLLLLLSWQHIWQFMTIQV